MSMQIQHPFNFLPFILFMQYEYESEKRRSKRPSWVPGIIFFNMNTHHCRMCGEIHSKKCHLVGTCFCPRPEYYCVKCGGIHKKGQKHKDHYNYSTGCRLCNGSMLI